MNKPLSMIINETKTKLICVCNESGLSPVLLDLIMQGVYSEIHSISEQQVLKEKFIYTESIKENEDVDSELV